MTVLKRNPAIIWRVERQREAEVKQALAAGDDPGERGTVLLIDSGTMHQLNLVGGTIWQLIDGTRTAADIVADLAVEYDVSQDELIGDVEAFTSDLLQRGWLLHG
jgi:pyrroloquinoline quinone biosynthesis protein D